MKYFCNNKGKRDNRFVNGIKFDIFLADFRWRQVIERVTKSKK